MKKISIGTLVLLLPVLAALSGLTALPAVCRAQENLSVTMSLDKGPVIQAGDSVTVTLTPSGGRPPYYYRYIMMVYEQGVSHHSLVDVPDSSHTWMVGFGESVLLRCIVWDADWKETDCEATLAVQEGVYSPFTITSRSLSPGDVINVGEPITYSVIAQGGQPPYSYSYRLTLHQEDCSIQVEDASQVYSSNSFSYTPTRGIKGYISSNVEDAAGRKAAFQGPLMFAILGDQHPPMGLTATQSVKTQNLSIHKYQLAIKASATGGTLPLRFYCVWTIFENDEIADRVFEENGAGKFILNGNFERVTTTVWAKDADGWTSDSLRFTFDPSIKEIQPPFERIRINPLDLFDPDWRRNPAVRLDVLLGTDPSSNPFLDAAIPEMIQLKPVRPGLIKPEGTAPEIVRPETLLPGMTAPRLPALQQPIHPKP
ncbi:MAG: hypothetical protein ACOX62_04980 [Christensenellales bacterium]|jgi:hypothetical protein